MFIEFWTLSPQLQVKMTFCQCGATCSFLAEMNIVKEGQHGLSSIPIMDNLACDITIDMGELAVASACSLAFI
jgi:hypothetical protein